MDTEYKKAPDLRVACWIDSEGQEINPLNLSDFGDGYKIIFCFQHWCPGCHSHGFPVLKKLINDCSSNNIQFVAIQTVFEGFEINTVDKLRENQAKYALSIPFGHDAGVQGKYYPSIMDDYQTRGTPWFIVINSNNIIIHSDFHFDPQQLV